MSRGRGYRGGGSTGGRGSSSSYRGSPSPRYRGNSSRGSSYNYGDHSMSRGGGSSSRYTSGNSGSYEHTYNSPRGSSKYQGDRYNNGNRYEDNHRRQYRQSSRERSMERKRTRHDHGPPVSRRSIEYSRSSSIGSGYSGNRYDANPIDSYNRRQDTHSRSNHRSPQYAHGSSSHRMPPPPSPTRYNGVGRGRRSRERMGPPKRLSVPMSRSLAGVPNRSGDCINEQNNRSSANRRGSNISRGVTRPVRGVIRRTSELRPRKVFPTLKSRDYAKRLKIARMRSSIKRRSLPGKAVIKREIRRSTSNTNPDLVNDDEEEEAEEDEEDIDIESKAEKKSVRSTSASSSTSHQAKKTEESDVKKSVDVANFKTEVVSPKKVDKRKNDEAMDVDKDIGDARADESRPDADDDTLVPNPLSRKRSKFIQLTCVHCHMKCVQFKEFNSHLYGRTHKIALRRLAVRQRAQLSRMRLAQRNAQRKLEEESKDTEAVSSQFCLLCRLNYRQPKAEHQASEAHRNMKKFLMPYCTVCRIGFKSPMVYETHRCSLEHIKRKARQELAEVSDEEREYDMNQFTTLDSVGDIDGGNGDEEELTTAANESQEINDIDEMGKQEITVGSEHVKKVERYYCELCRYYLPYQEEQESALKRHCITRTHLRSYLRYKEDQNLKKEAEKVHWKRMEENVTNDKDTEIENDKKSEAQPENTKAEDDENDDDKIWDDVGKDLGELLNDIPENERNEDEEDNSSVGGSVRYDRFRNSEVSDKKNSDVEDENDTIEKMDDDKTEDMEKEEDPEVLDKSKTEDENENAAASEK